MEHLSAANTQFSLNLFKKISGGNPPGNVFYFLFLISALAMVSLGARGNTEDQVLGFKGPGEPYSVTPEHHVDEIHSSLKTFRSELNKPGVPESEAARVNINKLVNKKSDEKTKVLVPPRAVNGCQSRVVVNALFFKGNWLKNFPEESTRDGLFRLNKNETKPVKMMTHKDYFPLASIPEMNSQILELSYVGDLSMFIVLSNDIIDESTGLLEIENELISQFRDWTRLMRLQVVQVSLPRLTMEERNNMNRSPDSMSVEIHTNITETTSTSPPAIFNADHPFLYFIRHNPSNSILFYGRVCSP